MDGYQITAGGFLARTADGAALAGVFNGQFGADTALTIDLPADWDRDLAIQVTAVDAGTALPGPVDAQIAQWQVTFQYDGSVSGRAVDHYEISSTQ